MILDVAFGMEFGSEPVFSFRTEVGRAEKGRDVQYLAPQRPKGML